MKKHLVFAAGLLLGLATVRAQNEGPAPFAHPPEVRYTLLDGSSFVDDCLVCGRPTILQPLRGTFDLVLLRDTPPLTEYAVRNIDLVAGPGFNGKAGIKGSGVYRIFAEFANVQSMELMTEIRDQFTNHTAWFTNGAEAALRPFPLIEIELTQTNGVPLQTFGLHLVAAPVREAWFSLNQSLDGTNDHGAINLISGGDLISNRGRVVKKNINLVGALGVMPIVPDLGLDAVDVTRHGEIVFSIDNDVWSETLGSIQNGDLLSDRGRIVKRNQQLLAGFGVNPDAADAGLDAVQLRPDGEILFSIASNVAVGAGNTLGHGDILSDKGVVFRSNRQLLAAFHPTVTNIDYGLDALSVLPGGEIWFSVTEGFMDHLLGLIQPGDVLSDRGYRVFSNRQMIAEFKPDNPAVDHGLDALFVVTGLKPGMPPPRFHGMKHDREHHRIRLEWDGEGSVFQLEKATNIFGPWEECGPLAPDLSFEEEDGPGDGGQLLYRLRQW